MRRGLSLLCALALALSLSACTTQEPQPTGSASPEPTPAATLSPAPTVSPSAEPTPTPEPTPPVFDEDHTLDRPIPELTSSGLELPVNGATGYASVKLGLWAEHQPPGRAVTRLFKPVLQKAKLSPFRKGKPAPVAHRVQANDFRRSQPDRIRAAAILVPQKSLVSCSPAKPL